ncbi:MAG: Epimerase family protein, partial [Mycobacterium sp.]|nr:Epimerase family protein [Mycobacterium sp.]
MHIALTGGSGLLGSALRRTLPAAGHRLTVLVRRPPQGDGEVRWGPTGGEPDDALVTALGGVDAIVHLAGAGVADRPWTAGYRATILDSRVAGTGVVSRLAAAVRPRVLLSASAVGYY